jgi:hypothetical protein
MTPTQGATAVTAARGATDQTAWVLRRSMVRVRTNFPGRCSMSTARSAVPQPRRGISGPEVLVDQWKNNSMKDIDL